MNYFGLQVGDYIDVLFDGDDKQQMVGPITKFIDGGCIIRDGVEVIYKHDEIIYIDDIEKYLENENE